MRFYLILFILLISCGTSDKKGHTGDRGQSCTVEEHEEGVIIRCEDGTEEIIKDGDTIEGPKGSPGLPGERGKKGEDYYSPRQTNFAGYYIFPNGGYIELLQTEDERVIIYSTQRIYSVNYDMNLALHPNLPGGPHFIRNKVVSGEYNTNYNSDTNDLERDGTTSNITDNRKTKYTISIQEDKKLRINLIVYDDDGLVIEANRTIISK